MLSIGKLRNDASRDAGRYYLEQVAQAREDYYIGRGEAEGEWLGHGTRALGLHGTVRADAFLSALARRHPLSGAWLGALAKDGQEPVVSQRTPGFDLTFSAPKSVSVLWALADREVSRQVSDGHDAAVRAAIRFVEERALRTRRGHGGTEHIATTGLICGCFRHRCSRAGDPALHSHCVVANVVMGADGRWSALDGRLLYLWGKTAGYLYQAELRRELTERLGVSWTPAYRGTAEIEGVDPAICRAFSRRRQEIEQRMEERGECSARAAQVAALDTRQGKEYGVDGANLFTRWRERAARLGVTDEEIRAVLEQTAWRPLTSAERAAVAEGLASPEGLTKHQSTFGERESIQAWAQAMPLGARIEDILRESSTFLASPQHVVELGEREGLRAIDVIRREDGRAVHAATDPSRYSTPELLDTERRLLDAATARSADLVAVAPPPAIDAAVAGRPYLSDEQVHMVHAVAGGGDGVVVVVGRPGAGKTSGLAACHDAWAAAGHRVIGAALAAEAARTLECETAIPSSTVTQLLADLRDPEHGGLTRNTVVVVDEAAMVGTRQLAPILDAAARARAKVVLVGDDHQLPEIDAGGAFLALRERVHAVELVENRRQRNTWEREALELLRGGEAARAVAAYQSRDALVLGHEADAVRRQLVAEWHAARSRNGPGVEEPVMIAARRADVEELNAHARALRMRSGELRGGALEVAGRNFAVDDRVVATRNARGLGVRNGTRGTVTAIDHRRRALHVRTDDGAQVVLPGSYVARGLRHGYALTAHRAQGKTVSEAFVLVDNLANREWAYTALSRAVDGTRIYAAHPAGEGLRHGARDTMPESLIHAWERSQAQRLALSERSPGRE